jgi:hypothetical protein
VIFYDADCAGSSVVELNWFAEATVKAIDAQISTGLWQDTPLAACGSVAVTVTAVSPAAAALIRDFVVTPGIMIDVDGATYTAMLEMITSTALTPIFSFSSTGPITTTAVAVAPTDTFSIPTSIGVEQSSEDARRKRPGLTAFLIILFLAMGVGLIFLYRRKESGTTKAGDELVAVSTVGMVQNPLRFNCAKDAKEVTASMAMADFDSAPRQIVVQTDRRHTFGGVDGRPGNASRTIQFVENTVFEHTVPTDNNRMITFAPGQTSPEPQTAADKMETSFGSTVTTAPVGTIAPKQPEGFLAKALFAYTAASEGQLSMAEGEVFTVVDNVGLWWVARFSTKNCTRGCYWITRLLA